MRPSTDRPRDARARARRDRRGFTLAELILSVMLLSVGLLALASSAATLTGVLSAGGRQVLAASAAQARFERMRSVSCHALAGGSASGNGISETWIKTDTARAVVVVDTVRFTIKGVTRVRAYRSAIPCV